MDVDYQSMPPAVAPYESDEERNRRLVSLAGGMPAVTHVQPASQPPTSQTMPPVASPPQSRSQASPRLSAMPPISPSDDGTGRRVMRIGENGQLAQPSMPPVGRAPMSEATPIGGTSAMPPIQAGPAQQRLEELNEKGPPQPKWWQKALEIAGSIHPIGRLIESQIPSTPLGYNTQLKQAAWRAAQEQSAAGTQATQGREAAGEARAAEAAPIKNRLETAQAREAEARADQLEAKPEEEHQDIVKEFSDALAKGDTARIDALAPRVQQYMAATKPQKDQPDKVDKKIDEFVDPKNNRINVMQRPDGTTYNVARGQSRSEAGVGTPSDVKDIADGIKGGIDPPDLSKYGYRDRTAIAAELKRQGFDLSTASQDWTATQKHLATLNGAQQERLRQAVSFTSDSLGIIDNLYDQWQKVGPTSGWKVFNKASLAASKQLPGEAGNLAHRLEAQISDLTSELGTVYKGGNSSTDESLKLAAKNLEADWNEKTFKDSIGQIRQNLEIRKNSIRHSQPAGVSENSPYTPRGESGAAPKAGDVEGGYKFKGGDPSKKENWEKQ